MAEIVSERQKLTRSSGKLCVFARLKSIDIMGSYSHDEFIQVKDYIDVLATLTKTILAIFALCWWERRNRKKEKERANTQIITNILIKYYKEAEEAYRFLKKDFSDLQRKKIKTESCSFTEMDVLLYLCHSNNWQFDSRFDDSPGKSHLCYIMEFFNQFSIGMHLIDRECPANIKEEYSMKIIEMGLMTFLFIPDTQGERFDRIRKVLRYFGGGDDPIHICDTVQEGNQRNPGTFGEQRNRNEVVRDLANSFISSIVIPIPRADLAEIENEIPYINHFRYRFRFRFNQLRHKGRDTTTA